MKSVSLITILYLSFGLTVLRSGVQRQRAESTQSALCLCIMSSQFTQRQGALKSFTREIMHPRKLLQLFYLFLSITCILSKITRRTLKKSLSPTQVALTLALSLHCLDDIFKPSLKPCFFHSQAFLSPYQHPEFIHLSS